MPVDHEDQGLEHVLDRLACAARRQLQDGGRGDVGVGQVDEGAAAAEPPPVTEFHVEQLLDVELLVDGDALAGLPLLVVGGRTLEAGGDAYTLNRVYTFLATSSKTSFFCLSV